MGGRIGFTRGAPPPQGAVPSAEEGAAAPGRARLLAALLTGTYAWALTVLPALAPTGLSSPSGVLGLSGLGCLYLAPLAPRARHAVLLSLDGFVGLSFLALLLTKESQVSPPFPIFGALGWVAFTFALGSMSRPGREEESPLVGDSGRLSPRTPPSLLAGALLAVILILCLLLLGSAWSIPRPPLAVLGHVLVLFAVLLLLRGGAHLSAYFQSRGTRLSRPLRLRRALLPLLSLVVLSLGFVAMRMFAR